MSPITPSDVRNEDWLRTRTWDIWLDTKLVTTFDQLRSYCDRQDITVDHFLTLPAAEAMPAELKQDAALWRQERLADRLRDVDPTAEGKAAPGVLSVMEEVLDKGIFSRRVRRVETPEGAEHYDQPVGSIIKPDIVPNAPRRRGLFGRGRPKKPDAGATPKPEGPKEHRGIREGWGGTGGRAGETFLDPTTRNGFREPRPLRGRWLNEQMTNFRTGQPYPGYYGQWSMADYITAIKEGAFDADPPTQKSFWLDSDGNVHAVKRHDSLVGEGSPWRDPDGRGWMRVKVASRNIKQNMTPLTNPMLDVQFTQKPTPEQRAALKELMGALETSYVNAAFVSFSAHFKDALRRAGGDYSKTKAGPTLNQQYQFDDGDEADAFFGDHKKVPKKTGDVEATAAEQVRMSYAEMQRLLREVPDPERRTLKSAIWEALEAGEYGDEAPQVKALLLSLEENGPDAE